MFSSKNNSGRHRDVFRSLDIQKRKKIQRRHMAECTVSHTMKIYQQYAEC